MNKSRMFSFRLSEQDYLSIQQKAARAKNSMTAFIIGSALEKKIVVVDGLENTLAALKAIGRNLNQLTTLCNMGKIQCLELADIKNQFGAVVEAVTGLMMG